MGQFEFQLKASNTVGSISSDVEIAAATYPPPQPIIKGVIAGNRQCIIDIKCDGWNSKEKACWFEVDVNPVKPDLIWLQNDIYTDKNKKKKATNQLVAPTSKRTMNRLQSIRTRGTFSTILTDIDLTASLSIDSPCSSKD